MMKKKEKVQKSYMLIHTPVAPPLLVFYFPSANSLSCEVDIISSIPTICTWAS